MATASLPAYEKLGAFYLGREYDLQRKKLSDNPLLYDAKDLVTHAVCVGMTGSGKTGLGIALLEEAALDGIPAIVVDPKGDMANLLLTFDDLSPRQFRPWINEEDARKKGMEPAAFAEAQANFWRDGLSQWGQDADRIKRLRDAAEFTIYTPGSSAGVPVSILKSFAAPPQAVIDDHDLLSDKIQSTVTSLLSLIGEDADPLQSREHILISTIIDTAWRDGRDLDLAEILTSIQEPPISRIGVFDLESFFPAKDRFRLAMKLNNLIAAPGFASWLEGEPLDIDRFYHTRDGRPKISILSIAHLNETERMFFVSLLLGQLLSWTRAQSGTSSLRAIFYMDEIFGYMPPVANPPSKGPLLTLLKQARAYGQGLVLATQNPVDLDYKGLSNTGTWFIGRLQTDRDKQRVLDGLEGASASGKQRFDRGRMEEILAGLGKRVFLMNNVHEDEPAIFQTRWVMSYLRGPITRNQVKKLGGGQTVGTAADPPVRRPARKPRKRGAKTMPRPLLPPGIPQYFTSSRDAGHDLDSLAYEPYILGIATLYIANAKLGVAVEREVRLLGPLDRVGPGNIWRRAENTELKQDDLEFEPETDAAEYGELPAAAAKATSYTAWKRDLVGWLYRNETIELLKSPQLKLVSKPGEDERAFRIRLRMAATEQRDKEIEKLRKKYASKLNTLEDRIRRSQHAVERETEQAKQQKMSTVLSVGATILGALFGRKAASLGTLGRASTAARSAGRVFKEGEDVNRAREKLAGIEARLTEMQLLLEDDIARIRDTYDNAQDRLDTLEIRPYKKDIAVSMVGLIWQPGDPKTW